MCDGFLPVNRANLLRLPSANVLITSSKMLCKCLHILLQSKRVKKDKPVQVVRSFVFDKMNCFDLIHFVLLNEKIIQK